MSNNKITTYGEIDFSQIDDYELLEAKYGNIDLNKIGLCKINIYSDEGQIAHFHIEKDNFKCCVCINYAKYFIHQGKEDTLNSSARKVLNNYLHKISNNGLTHWQNIQNLFYINNTGCLEKRSTIQPDYTKLKETC